MHKTKPCKYCAQEIPAEARVCPHCQEKQGWTLGAQFALVLVIFFVLALIGRYMASKPRAGHPGGPALVREPSRPVPAPHPTGLKTLRGENLSVGDLFHITGCDEGDLILPTVGLWDRPGGLDSGAEVIERLPGDGEADEGFRCRGALVRLVDVSVLHGLTYVKVRSVVNSTEGWVTKPYVGEKFDPSDCRSHFTDPAHIRNCLGE